MVSSYPVLLIISTDCSTSRGLSRLQVVAVPQPEHAIPHQPGVLPQDVRVLRRSNILFGASQLPSSRLPKNPTQEQVPPADLRRHQR